MKEFEKWFSRLDDSQLMRFSKQNRLVGYLAWEAALKWAINQPLCNYSTDIIKEELKSQDPRKT